MPVLTGARAPVFIVLLALCAGAGCSVKKFAINKVGDALASGGSTYETDEDLQLVGDALPFGLKLIETMLAESPRHRGLLQSACQGFATYSYLYVQNEAEVKATTDLAAADILRARARRLFLRAHRYGYRGLDVAAPGLTAAIATEPASAVKLARNRKDIPLLYWNAVALGLAISVSKTDASMLARIPEVQALIDRAIELDESWQRGSLHEFQVIFAGAKPGTPDFGRIEKHYRRALELTEGRSAGVHVSYAESVCVPKQDREGFRAVLEKALAIDPYEREEGRLQNLVANRRARWLLDRTDDLFLPAGETAGEETK